MAGPSLGSASLVLTANAARLQAGLDGAFARVHSWKNKAASLVSKLMPGVGGMVGGVVGAAAGAGIGSLSGKWHEVGERIDAANKKARAFGIDTQAFMGLQHAADLSGVSVEQLNAGLAKFAKGIDGPIDQALMNFAESTKDLDAAEKVRAFTDAFGKGGVGLIPMLEGGAAGLKEMQADATALGVALNAADADKFERANDALTRLTRSGEGLVTRVLIAAAPAIEFWADAFTDLMRTGQPVFDWVGRAIEGWWAVLGPFAREVGVLFLELVQGVWDWVKSWTGAGSQIPTVGEVIKTTLKYLGLAGATAFDVIRSGIGAVAVALGTIVEKLGQARQTFRDFFEKVVPAGARPDWLNDWIGATDRAAGGINRAAGATREWGQRQIDAFGSSARTVDAWFDRLGRKKKEMEKPGRGGQPSDQGGGAESKYVANVAAIAGTAEEFSARARFAQAAELGRQQLTVQKAQLGATLQVRDGVNKLVGRKADLELAELRD